MNPSINIMDIQHKKIIKKIKRKKRGEANKFRNKKKVV
jgi:hypothetical protein